MEELSAQSETIKELPPGCLLDKDLLYDSYQLDNFINALEY